MGRRLPSGQRYFDDSDVRKVLQPGFDVGRRKVLVYCRVSSPGQKVDLAVQVGAMRQFCLARGLAVDEWVSEVGGGMNLRREKFMALMDCIDRGEVRHARGGAPGEDLLAIVHSFSCRLDGLRRYERELEGRT